MERGRGRGIFNADEDARTSLCGIDGRGEQKLPGGAWEKRHHIVPIKEENSHLEETKGILKTPQEKVPLTGQVSRKKLREKGGEKGKSSV